MSDHENAEFRVKLGRTKPDQQRFSQRILRAIGHAGRQGLGQASKRSGRGQIATRQAQGGSGRSVRRVMIKMRIANLKGLGAGSTPSHLRYIEREGVGRDGEAGLAYGPLSDSVSTREFAQRVRTDRHQFRLIVAPEDAAQLGDIRRYARELMNQMAVDLETSLDWLAVDHWDTQHPHTHIVLRGRDSRGADLVIAREYVQRGLRQRAQQVATQWLGPRSEREIARSQQRVLGMSQALSQPRSHKLAKQLGCQPKNNLVLGINPWARRATPKFV